MIDHAAEVEPTELECGHDLSLSLHVAVHLRYCLTPTTPNQEQ